MYPADVDEFIKLTHKGNLIPVYEEYSAAFETPLSVYLKLKKGVYGFLLESVERGQSLGRYSFISPEPYLLFTAKNNRVTITEDNKAVEFSTEDPLRDLEKIFKRYNPVKVPGLQGFTGGAVGYLAYDMVRYFEKLPERDKDKIIFPDCMFMFTDTLVIFDHVRQVMQIVVNSKVSDNPANDYEQAKNKIENLKNKLNQPLCDFPVKTDTKRYKRLNYQYNVTPAEFHKMVNTAKEYIAKGDIFQVVLSQRITVQLEKEPLEIYRILRSLNPSPYMFYLHLNDLYFVGSSPELLVKVENNRAEVRPIAGTRPRGCDDQQEKELEKELINDEKERAEHLMLVDLGRNDLGRTAKYGSVKMDSFMQVEKYSHVMHLVSKVTGEVQPEHNCFDVLRSCFPAGTVSGAPKIRAIEIIDELEPDLRGPYAGAVGYINYNGDMDTCITIRTLIIKDRVGFIQAGAGIVADSDPLKEYDETLNKGKALLRAVETAEGGESDAARNR